MNEFEKIVRSLTDKCGICKLHAECYLCNFYNEFICKGLGGTCKNITKCQAVFESEKANKWRF